MISQQLLNNYLNSSITRISLYLPDIALVNVVAIASDILLI